MSYEERQCVACGQVKPGSCFTSRKKLGRRTLRAQCKSCMSKRARITYTFNPNIRKETAKRNKKNRDKNRDEFNAKRRAARKTLKGRRAKWRETMLYRHGSVTLYLAKQKQRNEASDYKVMRERVAMRMDAENAAMAAWRYWLENAPDWWLDAYWRASPEPWKDPRLNGAAQYRLRYRFDAEFQIKERIRRQIKKRARRDGIAETIRSAFRRGCRSPTVEKMLGYSVSELREHLERQFTRGMTWEKFLSGEIHIDHIIPQAAFDLSNHDEWQRCWCMSNLRPLWAKQNRQKRDKIVFLL